MGKMKTKHTTVWTLIQLHKAMGGSGGEGLRVGRGVVSATDAPAEET